MTEAKKKGVPKPAKGEAFLKEVQSKAKAGKDDDLKVFTSEPNQPMKEVHGKDKTKALQDFFLQQAPVKTDPPKTAAFLPAEPGESKLKLVTHDGEGKLVPYDPKDPDMQSLPWNEPMPKANQEVATLPGYVSDDLPTDRQIKNAERVLKMAGLDPESKISEAVAQALQNTQANGTFINEGVLQEPIETGLRIMNTRINSDYLEYGFNIPYKLVGEYEDKTFSLYRLITSENELYFIMDNNSTVNISGGDTRPNGYRHRQVAQRGVLLLINSSSNDDVVLGESTLVNTESAFNVLNGTTLVRHKEPRGGYPRIFRQSEDANLFVRQTKERFNVSECRFKRASIWNSEIAKGEYAEVQILDSAIRSAGFAHVAWSQIEDSTIKGSRITTHMANLKESTVQCEGEVALRHYRASHVHIGAKAVYIPNKFCFLEVDTPQHKLYFVRVSRNEFELGSNPNHLKRFSLNASAEELRMHIITQLAVDEEGFPINTTSLIASVGQYLTDVVVSRLKVVRLLDEAQALVEEVAPTQGHYHDMYSI